ncbi:MAG TPA: transcriptional regulator GcvA [Burkholderiales bacterium]|nr:transcriptional regulator GcvA [Burkholderiales bacterium]
MAKRLPPLHALSAFEAIARLRSFSRAAEELAITQSAVSRRIRQLEEQFDTRFFIRSPRGVALTADGERLLSTVQKALAELAEAARCVSGARERLRVSVAPALANLWLVPRLGEFQAACPEVDLEIHATLEIADLRAGDADVGIRSCPGGWPGLQAVRLTQEFLIPVCSPEYPRTVGGLKRPADLDRAVLLRNDRLGWGSWFRAAGLNRAEPDTGPLYSEVESMLRAAANGRGVALGLSTVTNIAIARGELVRLFDVCVPSPFSYYATCTAAGENRRTVRAFIDWLLAQFGMPAAA